MATKSNHGLPLNDPIGVCQRFATIDHDIGRFTMSIIMHREVEGLFRNPLPPSPRDWREAVCWREMEGRPWTAGGCSVLSDTLIVVLLRKHSAKE
jgi:hypothetical protein